MLVAEEEKEAQQTSLLGKASSGCEGAARDQDWKHKQLHLLELLCGQKGRLGECSQPVRATTVSIIRNPKGEWCKKESEALT